MLTLYVLSNEGVLHNVSSIGFQNLLKFINIIILIRATKDFFKKIQEKNKICTKNEILKNYILLYVLLTIHKQGSFPLMMYL